MESFDQLYIFAFSIISLSTIIGLFHCINRLCIGISNEKSLLSVSNRWKDISIKLSSSFHDETALSIKEAETDSNAYSVRDRQSEISQPDSLGHFDHISQQSSTFQDSNGGLHEKELNFTPRISAVTRPLGRYFHIFRNEEYQHPNRQKQRSKTVNISNERDVYFGSDTKSDLESNRKQENDILLQSQAKKRSNSILSGSSQSSEKFSSYSLMDEISDEEDFSLPPREEIVIDEKMDESLFSNPTDTRNIQNLRKRKNIDAAVYSDLGLKKRKLDNSFEEEFFLDESDLSLEELPEIGIKRPRPSELEEPQTLKVTGSNFSHVKKRPRISTPLSESRRSPSMFMRLVNHLAITYHKQKKEQQKNQKHFEITSNESVNLEDPTISTYRKRISIINNQPLKQNIELLYSKNDIEQFIRRTDSAKKKTIQLMKKNEKSTDDKLKTDFELKKDILKSQSSEKESSTPLEASSTDQQVSTKSNLVNFDNTMPTNIDTNSNGEVQKHVKFDLGQNKVFPIPSRTANTQSNVVS